MSESIGRKTMNTVTMPYRFAKETLRNGWNFAWRVGVIYIIAKIVSGGVV